MVYEAQVVVQRIETDVLIIVGLAGTFAAIKAKEVSDGKVTLVSKGKLGKDSLSTFAAGVFRAVFPEDDRDAWFRKLADEEWLNIALDESYDRLLDMEKWGVEWEKTPDGKFERKEARWKLPVCMFHGPQMMEAMAKKVITSGVEVIGYTMVTARLTSSLRL